MAQPQIELKPGEVEIHGKAYKTVALRINELRAEHLNYGIDTDLISNAQEIVVKAVIADETGRVIATGHASENRGEGLINKTSALENCETSAVGRALAFLGYAGTEIRSADEMIEALAQQKQIKVDEELLKYNAEIRKHIHTIAAVKQAIYDNDLELVWEAWDELDYNEKSALWKPPSKGGVFTTREREFLKSDELAAINPARLNKDNNNE